MKKVSYFILFAMLITGTVLTPLAMSQESIQTEESAMQLGNFSVSLAVNDIAVSRTFYEKLGFSIVGGNEEQNWLIMKNGETKIGLFQGTFKKNVLTFNPGWDSEANPLAEFTDVRILQGELKSRGVTLLSEADQATTGPAHFILEDPDGNQIMVDQHVPAAD